MSKNKITDVRSIKDAFVSRVVMPNLPAITFLIIVAFIIVCNKD